MDTTKKMPDGSVAPGATPEEQDAAIAAAVEAAKAGEDPVAAELARIQNGGGKKKRTKLEKLKFTQSRVSQQIAELEGGAAGDEDEEDDEDLEDDEDIELPTDPKTTVTVGMLQKLSARNVSKSAVQLAEALENDAERELAKYHIKNTIKSTGNAQRDFDLAMVHVNAVRNSRVIEEVIRKPGAVSHSGAGGGGQRPAVKTEELTAQELRFTRPPWNLTKKEIIAKRRA